VLGTLGRWVRDGPEVLLNALAGLGVLPAGHAHQQVHAGAGTTSVILAAALIAVPAARAIVAVPAVAIIPATGRTGLVFIGELLG
jgi:hypothetical protein